MESNGSRYKLAPSICLREMAGINGYWAFDVEDGSHYELNATAYWILKQMEGDNPAEDVIREYINTFEIDDEIGRLDFYEAIQVFVKCGVLKKEG